MSELPASSIDLLAAAVADDEGIGVLAHSRDEATLSFPVVHATGKVIRYSIAVKAKGNELEASESKDGHQLPRFCPERHIVGDGGFCMYWESEQRFPVTDRESARRWLCVLADFLRYQERAAYLRRWPNGEAWAHGEDAAKAQRRAELYASNLAGLWPEWILNRELTAKRESQAVYRVERVGEVLFAAWRSPDLGRRRSGKGLLVFEHTQNGKTRCRSRVRTLTLFELSVALYEWQRAEDAFWNYFRDKPCCGTMDTCRLRKAS